MKQVTRENRRIAREAANAKYNMQLVQRQNQYNQEKRTQLVQSATKNIGIAVLIAIVVGFFVNTMMNEQDQYQEKINQKLKIWNAYKDKNCKEIEKLYGMQMGEGKLKYLDSGTVYQCNDGIKYTVTDKVAKGDAGLKLIPEVK